MPSTAKCPSIIRYYLVIKKNSDFDKNKLKYQVKGLIPVSYFNTINNNTEKISFDIGKLEPILKDLDKYWYNCNNNCNKYDFYKQQYFIFYNKAFTKYKELDYQKTLLSSASFSHD